MRVVILDTSNPDEMTGGQSVFIRNLVPRLAADVRVVGTTTGAEPLGRWQTRGLAGVRYRFMPVARMPAPGHKPLLPLRLSGCAGVARFRSRILGAGDVMYVHSPEMGLPLTLGPERKPVVLHMHGASNPLSISRYPWARAQRLQRAYALLQRQVVRASAAVLSVDQDGLAKARAWLPQGSSTRLERVPVCVDTSSFHPGDPVAARRELGLPPSPRILVFVGRLERAKGTEVLVDAFARSCASGHELFLVLLGDGTQRVAIAEQARRLGVADRVLAAGWVDHDELPVWFRACDLLVLPSFEEGLPTAAIEALACGVPVVATAIGGLPGLVEEGINGLLFTEPTAEMLTATLETALGRDWSVSGIAASVSDYAAGQVAGIVDEVLLAAVRATG